ncbi:MAG: 50S ribosomal protein L29 [Spirochaetales bacterium]|nr:50S ribosomal protein L29 [Spirochaetales bacterium]
MKCIYHEMPSDQIQKQLEEARSNLREDRFTFATARSLPDPGSISKTRKNIARMLTILRLRELGKASQVEGKVKKKSAREAPRSEPKEAEKAGPRSRSKKGGAK